MIRALTLLAMHHLLAWNARMNAKAQRQFVAKLEEELPLARNGIALYDRQLREAEARVRTSQSELRARMLAKRFQRS